MSQQEFHDEFRRTVRAAIASVDPLDPATSAHAWSALVELGVPQIAVPESAGGLGLGTPELALVSEELGRRAARTPFMSRAVVGPTVRRTLGDDSIPHDVAVPFRLSPDALSESAGRLHGEVTVLDSETARHALVPVTVGDGVQWFVIERSETTWTELADAVDLSRSLGRLEVDAVPARPVGTASAGAAALEEALHLATLVVAADQVGVARAALSTAVEYAGLREQFGQAIGTFQAVKHRCTESLLTVELAAASVTHAVMSDDLADAAVAALQSDRAAQQATDALIHLHGGTGFTWEHPAHVYFRRARAGAHLVAAPQAHRNAVAASLGL